MRQDAGAPPDGAVATVAELLALRAQVAYGARRTGRARALNAAGVHRALPAGRGLEFRELRAYQPGDDIRSIDWRHTALRGRPYTKVYQVEQERPLFLCIDQTAQMRFGTRQAFKSVQAARAATLLAWEAVLHDDRLGSVVHAGLASPPLEPGKGEAAVLNLIGRLCAARPHDCDVDNPALADILRSVSPLIQPGFDLVVLSDFHELDDQLESMLLQLSMRARVALIQVFDIFESSPPPPGLYRLADAHGETVIDLHDPAERASWGSKFRTRSARLGRLAAQLGGAHLQLATHDHPTRILAFWR